MLLRIPWIVSLLIAVAPAATVSGPVLGYAVTGERVRIVPGIPGAAYIGPPVDVRAADVRALAPDRGYAVVASGPPGIRTVALADGRELARWECSEGEVRSVLLSPLGTAAAVTCGDAVTHVLTGLPAQLVKRSVFRPPDSGTVPRAVSDDANVLTVVMSNGSVGVVRDGNLTIVAKTEELSDIRFIEATDDLLFTDAGWAQVSLVSDGSASILASGGRPVAAAYTGPGSRRVLVIATADKQLTVRSRTGSSETAALPCVPAGLERLNESTLRLVCQDNSHFYLVHAAPNGVRVLAVPEGGE